jgi:integrase
MASIRKLKSGWRAEVFRRGIRKSQVFQNKLEAKNWAAREEASILNQEAQKSQVSFGKVMDRYAREVSPAKRGARWEQIRLEKIGRDTLAGISMADLNAGHLADWRDRRLREVSPASVNREMVLLSAVLTQARKEWQLIGENPMSDVRKPTKPAARDRRVSQDELERLKVSAGEDLTKTTARAFHAFLFAIETAMRAGEVVGLEWDKVDLESRVCHLPMTKNGTRRDVPLSQEAVRLLEVLPSANQKKGSVFELSSSQTESLWRKIRDRAGVTDLHFHDSRHEAITRLSRKLDVLSLARMVGHRNLNQLMAYYNESAADLAKRLD